MQTSPRLSETVTDCNEKDCVDTASGTILIKEFVTKLCDLKGYTKYLFTFVYHKFCLRKIPFLTLADMGKIQKFVKKNIEKNPLFPIEFSTNYRRNNLRNFDVRVIYAVHTFVYFAVKGNKILHKSVYFVVRRLTRFCSLAAQTREKHPVF